VEDEPSSSVRENPATHPSRRVSVHKLPIGSGGKKLPGVKNWRPESEKKRMVGKPDPPGPEKLRFPNVMISPTEPSGSNIVYQFGLGVSPLIGISRKKTPG